MLDLVSSDNVAEVVALQEVNESVTTEEVCRAARSVEYESILLLKFDLPFLRQNLSPTVYNYI